MQIYTVNAKGYCQCKRILSMHLWKMTEFPLKEIGSHTIHAKVNADVSLVTKKLGKQKRIKSYWFGMIQTC